MGVRGAALATIISHGGAFLTAILYLNKTHKLVQLKLRELVFDWDIFRKSVRIGIPSGLQQTFVSVGMLALFAGEEYLIISLFESLRIGYSRIVGVVFVLVLWCLLMIVQYWLTRLSAILAYRGWTKCQE